MYKKVILILLTTISLRAFSERQDSTAKHINFIVKGDILSLSVNSYFAYKNYKSDLYPFPKTYFYFSLEKLLSKNKSVQATAMIKPWSHGYFSNRTWFRISADYKHFVSPKKSTVVTTLGAT